MALELIQYTCHTNAIGSFPIHQFVSNPLTEHAQEPKKLSEQTYRSKWVFDLVEASSV